MVSEIRVGFYEKLKASVCEYDLIFLRTARTSRGKMYSRKTWFVMLSDESGATGIGECAPLNGLSRATSDEVKKILLRIVRREIPLDENHPDLLHFPEVRFALETAKRDINNGGRKILYPKLNHSTIPPIPINGLVWMNDYDTMLEEATQKINTGFRCIKLKIGGIDFADELRLLQQLRNRYSPAELDIRLDANGAFSFEVAQKRLDALSKFFIHSIEQPIPPGQWHQMRALCASSPIPIALDEELIGIHDKKEKEKLLQEIRPAYLVLKPSLHGGLRGAEEWIDAAEREAVQWWATSALESNIGLNAIAQWVSRFDLSLPQGLGTGTLFANNIPSPWYLEKNQMQYDRTGKWNVSDILNGITLA